MHLKLITDKFNKKIIGVLGNHDKKGTLEDYGITDIAYKSVDIGGITLSGVDGCVRYKESFGYPLYEQQDIVDKCGILPKVDILVSHNSPYGVHDMNDTAHEGFGGLNNYIIKHSPLYMLHGHQHINKVTDYFGTKVIGVYGAVILDTEKDKVETIVKL